MIANVRSLSGIGKPKKPWERMHIDFMEFRGHKIFILVDSYLKWIKAWERSRSDATAVIDQLDNFIGTFGAPNIILSDTGPPFNSALFAAWCVIK
jgi:hypothetical protein